MIVGMMRLGRLLDPGSGSRIINERIPCSAGEWGLLLKDMLNLDATLFWILSFIWRIYLNYIQLYKN